MIQTIEAELDEHLNGTVFAVDISISDEPNDKKTLSRMMANKLRRSEVKHQQQHQQPPQAQAHSRRLKSLTLPCVRTTGKRLCHFHYYYYGVVVVALPVVSCIQDTAEVVVVVVAVAVGVIIRLTCRRCFWPGLVDATSTYIDPRTTLIRQSTRHTVVGIE